ncbi:MAG: N-formylglutamate amidohydrolase [Alphaproteobacteria bacterium]|nr:MAG: N-formylglutamate amidohydrolase [Alphaproteobacteria bacterium]
MNHKPHSADEAPPPFLHHPPAGAPTPFIFAVPHSGRYYPPSFLRSAKLELNTLRLSEDAFVDKLFEPVPALGATLLVATHARSYLDLNRGATELDAGMFNPPLDARELYVSHRVKAGLGMIPKQVAEGLNIYDGLLPAREALARVEGVHRPYHDKLRTLLDARRRSFGRAVLVDCHSMPSDSGLPQKRRGRAALPGPDIVLGDCWGTACGRELSDIAEDMLVRAGFSVRRNVPYAGGYITQHYGSPGAGIHALQIEINRALYMDEEKLLPLDGFADVSARLMQFATNFVQHALRYFPTVGDELPRAAE